MLGNASPDQELPEWAAEEDLPKIRKLSAHAGQGSDFATLENRAGEESQHYAPRWQLLMLCDVLGILSFAGLAQARDPSNVISLWLWTGATAVWLAIFLALALVRLSRFEYHLHLHFFGFVYCAVIHAGLPLHKNPPHAQSFADTLGNWPLLLFVTPWLWGAGACVALRDQNGRAEDSTPERKASYRQVPLLDDQVSLGGIQLPPPRWHGKGRAPHIHNLGFYSLPFLVGMLPNFLAKAHVLPDFSLSVRSFQGWGLPQYVEVSIGAAMLVHLLGYHLWRAHLEGFLATFAIGYGCMTLGLLVTIAMLHETHHVHLHHYFTAALLVPLTRFTGPIPAIWQGLLVGFQLQGVAVFGLPPLFYRVDQS